MFVKLYLLAVPIFFLVDMLWLGVVAKGFYARQIGFLMKTNVNWPAAIVFYLLFVAGLVAFVIIPAREQNSMMHALSYGALFGLISYATYDLTNLATLQGWPIVVTVVDLVWGSVLAASVAAATFAVAAKLRF